MTNLQMYVLPYNKFLKKNDELELKPEFEAWVHSLLVISPWANYVTHLSLVFIISAVETITLPQSTIVRMKWNSSRKALE